MIIYNNSAFALDSQRERKEKLLSIVMINKHTIIENMCLLINNIIYVAIMYEMNDSHVSISDVFVKMLNANCECRFINEELRRVGIRRASTRFFQQFISLQRFSFLSFGGSGRQKGPFLIKIVLTLSGSTDARVAHMYEVLLACIVLMPLKKVFFSF